MENQWAIPLTDEQRRHGVPPIAERFGPAFQQTMPTYQQGEGPNIQNCSCVWCSDGQLTQVRPTTQYPVEQKGPTRPFGIFDNRVEDSATVPDRAWAPFIPSRAADPRNFSSAPVQEIAGPEFFQASTPDASIAENLRRLAGQYLNNPGTRVCTIHIEPGPSGELQIVITLGMANIL